ncbi:indole-3-glycerol phosphate synthase TrpC [Bacillus sp. EB01]|uniref:indole-3-glycerol phosphate synthase TrpC n=1 Tax=Bacillus sp. EB01 TaxID=1347086 RepID=UPI0005C6E211|nr:indole-3-glycerol phosphate synthase TrpC [Bacillus sp. EB01]
METILQRILQEKEKEVSKLKETRRSLTGQHEPRRSLIERLKDSAELSIIAEYKRASPSKGLINNTLDPAGQARQYELEGAQAISVLTDSTFFKGSFEDLRAVREAVGLPILCKDFIIDEIQIDCAIESGADLILLIVAALEEERLIQLYSHARQNGAEVLVEVHDEKELASALRAGAELIGVNNRDLRTFKVSLDATSSLGPKVKQAGAFFISESGIQTAEDARIAATAGADGVLVGESLMKSNSLKESFAAFTVPKLEAAKK